MTNFGRMTAGLAMVALLGSPAAAEPPQRHPAPKPLVISQQAIARGLADPAARAAGRQPQATTRTHPAKRVMWTAIGAAGGFFAGGYAGAAIENAVHPCNCDDPGLMGALIGMPIGAVAGGVAGFLLSR